MELVVARAIWPGVDANGWRFILIAFPISCVVFATAGL
jgi:hypothetical protein